MKQIFTLLITIALSATVLGQNPALKSVDGQKQQSGNKSALHEKNHRHSFLPFSTGQNPSMEKTNSARFKSELAIKQRFDSVINEHFNYETNQYHANFKDEYLYYDSGNLLEERAYSLHNNQLTIFYKEEYFWDSEGNIIQSIGYYDETEEGNELLLDRKSEYSYNNLGKLTSFLYFHWIDSTSEWKNDWKEEYTYNSAQQLTQKIEYDINYDTEELDMYAKEVYTYDLNGMLTQKMVYYWDTEYSVWNQNKKVEYAYNTYGLVSVSTSYNWSSEINQWIYSGKNESSYDAEGDKTEEIEMHWNEEISQWINSEKRSWVFDSNRNLTSELYFNWDNETSQWIGRSGTEYAYNNTFTYNDLLLPLVENDWEDLLNFRHMCTGYTGWDAEEEKQNSLYKGNFYYSQQTVDIDDKNKISRMLYPNPTNDYFQISGTLLTGNTYLEIFDLAGKLIMKQQLANPSRISVEQFAKGCYLIQLKNSGQLLQSEKLIIY